ncbi:MAG: alpha-amylase family glycosyl hydrolase [Balneolaceae bacterium]|nr:alpha-amylase family glycosyl hydrolase [Balneolaceae bacterium]
MKNTVKSNMQRWSIWLLAGIIVTGVLAGCEKKTPEMEDIQARLIEHPEWSKDAVMYEVNIRQYTPEGTFEAFQEHLPRLKEMGVDILWLMPIHPIGEKNRKGELGSYYSIQDYTAVNSNFGTMEDFKNLVKATHEQGMKLIIDWVPNHTAWDHPWITEHPEYYMQDSTGQITYEADWSDTAQLNYENEEMKRKMIELMKFWPREADIDGYRVDHAGHDIPISFWQRAVPAVDSVKEIFWLAEWNTPEMHPWYDATYTWEYFHLTTEIAEGAKPLHELELMMEKEQERFPEHAYRLFFTTNHDENSWNGTDRELFGENFENFAVLAATIDGMPLIYSGQETGLEQQLEFFKKDTIDWDGYEYESFYTTLFELKERNPALWNGQYGGDYKQVPVSDGESVFAYTRTKGENEVFVAINISGEPVQVEFPNITSATEYTDLFSGEKVTLGTGTVEIGPHGHLVLER